MLQPIVDQKLRTTDPHAIAAFGGRVNLDYVEFTDYAKRSPYAKRYLDRVSGKCVQVISGLPMARPDDGSRLVAGWDTDGDAYHNRNNLFEGEVVGARFAFSPVCGQPAGMTVATECVWEPELTIGGVIVPLLSHAVLETDPLNANYHDNVIVWMMDYDTLLSDNSGNRNNKLVKTNIGSLEVNRDDTTEQTAPRLGEIRP